MKVRDIDKWEELLFANIESKWIIEFIEKWADLMEEQIPHGKGVCDVAMETSIRACNIVGNCTAAQVSYAAQQLDMHWMYGGNVYKSVFSRCRYIE